MATTADASARKSADPRGAIATPWARATSAARAAEMCSASLADTRLAAANTVTRMPRPSDAPSCCATFTRPDAAPGSSGVTPATPAVVSGVSAVPMPVLSSSIGGAIIGKWWASGAMRLNSTRPTSATAMPSTRRCMFPTRGPILGARRAAANITAVTGRNTKPAWSAL